MPATRAAWATTATLMNNHTAASYAEAKGAKPFDWHKFLSVPTHTAPQWRKAEGLAVGWITCACGTQCDALPRRPDGCPEDKELRHLGCVFYENISTKNINEAIVTLAKIEARSSHLLAQMLR